MKSPIRHDLYRWVVLSVVTAILAVAMGQLVNGLSVYTVPMVFSEGWDRGDIALINTSGLVGLAFGSVSMGFATERFGFRAIAVFGAVMTGLAILIASFATQLWQLYLMFFLAGVLGGGALSAPLMVLVGNWFPLSAGLAIGIASAGQAFGQGAVPFSAAYLIDAFGWRDAMFIQGVATLVVLVPIAFLLRNAPANTKAAAVSIQTPSGHPNRLMVAWLAVAALFCCICMSVPLMHLAPTIQGCGFGAPEVGGVLLVMLSAGIAGRIFFGKLCDLIGALRAYLIASAWQTLMVFGFYFLSDLSDFYIYGAIYGFGYAGVMTSIIVSARKIMAPAHTASSLGIVMAFAYIGHGIGGWQGGAMYDLTGSYQWTYANAAIAGVINLLIVASLWRATRFQSGEAHGNGTSAIPASNASWTV